MRYTLRGLLGQQAGTPQVVEVPRRGPQRPRTAQVLLRWAQVTLPGPANRPKAERVPVTLGVVWTQEVDPPAGVEPLDWLLLTTLLVDSDATAQRIVEYYLCRWGIEVWHKVLKSGCAFEQRQLASAENLQRALSLYSVIAWRIVYATMLARAVPDVPCTMLLDDAEWQGLYCRIHRVAIPPATPPTLRQAVRWIGQLGGFQGRKHDGEPGVTVLWKGFQHLVDVTAMYRIMRPAPASPARRIQNKDSG